MKFHTTIAAATLALLSATSFAQTPATATPRVDARQANQEQRIQQGRASGELTRHETRRLQRQQRTIARAEAHAKADGKVTPQERQRLTRMQDAASKDIQAQKHDAQTVPGSVASARK